MDHPSRYLESLTREFSRLPGIGVKSASRLAFHILKMSHDDVSNLVRAMLEVKEHITACRICGGIADSDVCSICSDRDRDSHTICIVENARDVLTIEGTGEFHGLYHVLMGVISPLDGIGPDELNISSLLDRYAAKPVQEMILALNPTVEGDATALYLAGILMPLGVRVTRIAHGLPVGSDLEFADSATIVKSFRGRVAM